jgi:hypothetical protein
MQVMKLSNTKGEILIRPSYVANNSPMPCAIDPTQGVQAGNVFFPGGSFSQLQSQINDPGTYGFVYTFSTGGLAIGGNQIGSPGNLPLSVVLDQAWAHLTFSGCGGGIWGFNVTFDAYSGDSLPARQVNATITDCSGNKLVIPLYETCDVNPIPPI